MQKTEKELAYLRGIYVEPEWTQKFTDLFDETADLDRAATIAYINAGAGSHVIELSKKLGADVELFPVCESAHLCELAQAKAEAAESGVDFSTSLPMADSDMVIADASLVPPADLNSFLRGAIKCCEDKFVFFLPTAGSFGEVFSYLWEASRDLGLSELEDGVENLITGLNTVEQAKEEADAIGLIKIESLTKPEFFEFETGRGFVESPLVRFFLLSAWLGSLDEKENERVTNELAQKIDADKKEVSFEFSVNVTVVSGQKG